MNAPKRVFVILGHKAAVTPDFTLSDLPGSAGRLDILARCVTAAFCLSHGIRADVEVYLVLRDEITVRFQGSRLKRLNPDERSTGALIQHALRARQEGQERSTPGVTVAARGLRAVLEELEDQGVRVYVLDEHGIDVREAQLPQPVAFVLSDHVNFTAEELALLQRYEKISLGPTVLHADHCIPIVHNELDRREASSSARLEGTPSRELQ
jgi:tRNA (pseudouridine54-N1)-methyltransferase